MSKIYDALRRADAARTASLPRRPELVPSDVWDRGREFKVVSVTSNKGGVGKTTIATNLAVYLRALREDMPVLLLGFDDQTMHDRMFELEPARRSDDMASALQARTFSHAARLGQYGVHFVPAHPDVSRLRTLLQGPDDLKSTLLRTSWRGLVLIDTKSDFEVLTQSAIEASDLSLVVVKDQSSLHEAQRVFDLLKRRGMPPERARVLLSLVDLRIKYREGEDVDILAHLVSEIRTLGYPLFETFVSRSPKVEALYTNPNGRALSILNGATDSAVHGQMRELAEDVLRALESPVRAPETSLSSLASRVPREFAHVPTGRVGILSSQMRR